MPKRMTVEECVYWLTVIDGLTLTQKGLQQFVGDHPAGAGARAAAIRDVGRLRIAAKVALQRFRYWRHHGMRIDAAVSVLQVTFALCRGAIHAIKLEQKRRHRV